VRATVTDLEETTPLEDRLSEEWRQTIQLVVLVYALDNLLREGSRAARGAVRQFQATGMVGFTVGKSVFTEENANVRLGEDLAAELRSRLPARVIELVESASGVGTLIATLVGIARRE
jgi:hypothetical protein